MILALSVLFLVASIYHLFLWIEAFDNVKEGESKLWMLTPFWMISHTLFNRKGKSACTKALKLFLFQALTLVLMLIFKQ